MNSDPGIIGEGLTSAISSRNSICTTIDSILGQRHRRWSRIESMVVLYYMSTRIHAEAVTISVSIDGLPCPGFRGLLH